MTHAGMTHTRGPWVVAAPELLALARKIASSSYQVQAADLIDMARSTLADTERRLGA
jgi:hypothetical protein